MPEIVNVDQARRGTAPRATRGWNGGAPERALAPTPSACSMAAAVDAGDHVLDVGCGCGDTTRGVRAAGGRRRCARRRPVDGDARARAGSVPRKRACTTSRSCTPTRRCTRSTPTRFDVVISRFGVMFFADPVAAFANVGRGDAPDGRLALVVWQELRRNEWLTAVRGALAVGRRSPSRRRAPGPFGFADPDRVRSILETPASERLVVDIEAPFCFGADADDAYGFANDIGLVRGLLQDSKPTTRRGARRPPGRPRGPRRVRWCLLRLAAWIIRSGARGRVRRCPRSSTSTRPPRGTDRRATHGSPGRSSRTRHCAAHRPAARRGRRAATDHVLDVGCGYRRDDAACARAAVDGDALGVDLSAAMLARARAARPTGARERDLRAGRGAGPPFARVGRRGREPLRRDVLRRSRGRLRQPRPGAGPGRAGVASCGSRSRQRVDRRAARSAPGPRDAISRRRRAGAVRSRRRRPHRATLDYAGWLLDIVQLDGDQQVPYDYGVEPVDRRGPHAR